MVDVIIGGQYGSEGKGKVSNILSELKQYDGYIRVGGTNSGHTFYFEEEKYIFRVLPCCLNKEQKNVNIFLPVGSYIDVDILRYELSVFKDNGVEVELFIDDYAVVITSDDIRREREITKEISSTGTGTGSALIKRIRRRSGDAPLFVKDCEELKQYSCDVTKEINDRLSEADLFLLEGTQGFGLSILHGRQWPYLTARDVTVMGFLSEAGISPYLVNDVYMVLRTYPIRVGGPSGPLLNELTWEEINKRKGGTDYTVEMTSVTCKQRRIAEIDYKLVNKAILVNRPTKIVMNFMDYIGSPFNSENHIKYSQLCFINDFESKTGQKIDYLGFDNLSMYRRSDCALD